MNRFDYVKYDEEAIKKQENFKQAFMDLENDANRMLPQGRALSLVLTKLEEAYMWVGKAIRDQQISRNGSAQEQPERTNS